MTLNDTTFALPITYHVVDWQETGLVPWALNDAPLPQPLHASIPVTLGHAYPVGSVVRLTFGPLSPSDSAAITAALLHPCTLSLPDPVNSAYARAQGTATFAANILIFTLTQPCLLNFISGALGYY